VQVRDYPFRGRRVLAYGATKLVSSCRDAVQAARKPSRPSVYHNFYPGATLPRGSIRCTSLQAGQLRLQFGIQPVKIGFSETESSEWYPSMTVGNSPSIQITAARYLGIYRLISARKSRGPLRQALPAHDRVDEMGLPIKLVWSNLRNEAARRWVAFPVVALAVLLGSLGWSVAMFNGETGGDVRVVGQWTVLLFALSFLLALMMGLVLLLRGRLHWPYLLPERVAIQMLNAILWTPGILGIVSISLGIVIYGKKFLRIEVFLDILKALRPG
jgi:hypothetical protein